MINVTVINGIPDTGYAEHEAALHIAQENLSKSHNIKVFTIRDMDINYCRGCFDCWVKTPGICMFKDDMPNILKHIVSADVLVFVSPVKVGFITSQLKRAMDRILSLLMPYIKIYNKECHHVPRYDLSIKMGLMLLDDGNVTEQSKECIYSIFDRLSRNLHTDIPFKATVDSNKIEEVLTYEACSY